MRFALLFLLVAPLAAQITPGHLVVLTSAPTAQAKSTLVDVDPITGVMKVLPRFAFDHHAPLAVAIDPVNGDVLVAVSDQGMSRLMRLQFVGGQLRTQRSLGSVSGTVTEIGFGTGVDLITSSLGFPAGAIHRHGRDASGMRSIGTFPSPTAFEVLVGDFGTVVDSGSGTATLTQVDLSTGKIYRGPIVLPGLTNRITGVHDLPTGAIRQVVTDTAGQLHLIEFMSSVRTIPTTPALPAGSLQATVFTGGGLLAVGGSSHPYLISMPVFGTGAGQWQQLAGPFLGDPVDLAQAGHGGAYVVNFGHSCSVGGGLTWHGRPMIGNAQFSIGLGGAQASSPALFVFGADDHFSGPTPLPFQLSACLLHVAPDIVVPVMTSATGYAQMPIPVPNQPALVGGKVFAQWLVQGATMGLSDAASIWIGN